jgi:carbonic anhydrase
LVVHGTSLTHSLDSYTRTFTSNESWATHVASSNPDLFPTLAKGQHPEILWIGCSDSRCPETTILGLQPGDVFVHRNIANILTATDLNSLSVIQYAVEYLKVKHVVVCGHTNCGGVAAALANKKLGLIDTWLLPLRALRKENLKLLQSLEPTEAALKLVELNVRASVEVLEQNTLIIDAVAERGLKVHGLIYDISSGKLKELHIQEDEDTIKSRETAFKIQG